MIIEGTNTLNSTVQTNAKISSMRLSKDAEAKIFEMFTNNIYSDPIGTVVREITSNCFDAHAEQERITGKKVEKPVILKLHEDTLSNKWFLSFIDFGVGMSPDRVENIYGVYFESTKTDNNEEIGGFGLGGKTPLAYNKNGFFVITRHNGIEYTYNIVAGKKAPQIILMSQVTTDEENGTEVKIQLNNDYDKQKFASAIHKQLHYFENVYFEGFEEYSIVQNNYLNYKCFIMNKVPIKKLFKYDYDFKEYVAIILYIIGVQPYCTTFIDGETMVYGYGKLDGWVGLFEYTIPFNIKSDKIIL